MTGPAFLAQPFEQQIAALTLRLGNLVPTSRWDDLRHNEHDRAFMVAGALKADLLNDLSAAIYRAGESGEGIAAFRRDFRAIVERHGWHGWTGEGTKRGEAWRTRVIYQTNMATSRAAGRMAQLREGEFRFWVYRHGGSRDPRPQHLAWDGLALPPDHPFWATHYPPNGWGCSCYVRGARSEAGVRRLGGDPDLRLPEDWQARDPRTGTPGGIDKGWDYAPGATTADPIARMTAQMAEKAAGWDPDIAAAWMRDLPPGRAEAFGRAYRALPTTEDALRRWGERVLGERGGAPIDPRVMVEARRSLGPAGAESLRRIAAADPDLGARLVAGPVPELSLSREAARAALEAAPKGIPGARAAVPADLARLGQLIDAPDSVETLAGPGGAPDVIHRRRQGDQVLVGRFRPDPESARLELIALWIEPAP